MKHVLGKHVEVNSIPRSHVKKLGVAAHVFIHSARELRQEVTGWTAALASVVSCWIVKYPDSKTQSR